MRLLAVRVLGGPHSGEWGYFHSATLLTVVAKLFVAAGFSLREPMLALDSLSQAKACGYGTFDIRELQSSAVELPDREAVKVRLGVGFGPETDFAGGGKRGVLGVQH